MSVTASEQTCVLCETPVLTDDSANAVTVERDGWAHRACAERHDLTKCPNCGTYDRVLFRRSPGLGRRETSDPQCSECWREQA